MRADTKEGKAAKATYDRLEELADEYNKNVDEVIKIEEQIDELTENIQQANVDFLGQIRETLEQERQKEIDALSEVNDSINDSNSKLMDSINKSISKMRQDRENEKTEQDLTDKRAQLALLKRDTSGANISKIKQLEKEIAEAEENYTDSLVDQNISALQDNLDEAGEQRQRQIELLTEILEVDKENGVLARQAEEEANKYYHGVSVEILDRILESSDD